jgi:heme iron utilization protein
LDVGPRGYSWQNRARLKPPRKYHLSDLEKIQTSYHLFIGECQTLHIASKNSNQDVIASYAPFVRRAGSYYLYLSRLAAHYNNLSENAGVGLLLIRDESSSPNSFARERLQLTANATKLSKNHPDKPNLISRFKSKFGKQFELIEPLPDFDLFELSIKSGRYIYGFAQAYELYGDNMDELRHIDPRI